MRCDGGGQSAVRRIDAFAARQWRGVGAGVVGYLERDCLILAAVGTLRFNDKRAIREDATSGLSELSIVSP